MTKTTIFIIAFYCFFCSIPSFALSKLGHQLVCQLAYEQLSTPKQQKIQVLLQAIPLAERQRINRYNHLNKHAPIMFSTACSWADAIKNLPSYEKYNTWHYFNIPRSYSFIPINSCSANCLPQAIIEHQKQLSAHKRIMATATIKTKIPSWKTTQALLFLGHWLGDIHQPLHISYKSDLGGNSIKLNKKHRPCNNLHQYWDSCIFSLSKRTKTTWLKQLRSQWSNTKQYGYHEELVWQWADESYQIIIKPSFQYCHLVTRESQENVCRRIHGKLTLSDNYHATHLPIVELQLIKAAKRLKDILDASL